MTLLVALDLCSGSGTMTFRHRPPGNHDPKWLPSCPTCTGEFLGGNEAPFVKVPPHLPVEAEQQRKEPA